MDLKKKITISWSGGKDAALALFEVLSSREYELMHLHCIIDEATRTVGMHGIPESLVEAQAKAVGCPLVKGYLHESGSNQAYEDLVRHLYQSFATEGITHIVFGDIFLEDLKNYRCSLLCESGLVPVFPLWKKDSNATIKELIDAGFEAVLCAANQVVFDSGLLGRTIDESFLTALPPDVDPAGENGEFHTFVFDGPIFANPIPIKLGGTSCRSYSFRFVNRDDETEIADSTFYFQELLS